MMSTLRPLLLALSALGALLAAPAFARAPVCAPIVRDAWIRLLPGGMPMHAGFARIENPCREPVRIVDARSGQYRSVELHETTLVNGVSRMRRLRQLVIAPGQSAELRPGGLHLMLMQPQGAPLQPEMRVAITFVLADRTTFDVPFLVKAPN